MLVNPYLPENKELLQTIPGTHILNETLGVIGASLIDPFNPVRIWTVQGLYSPVAGRTLGGLRAKVLDQKGFISFINQRDLEVLLDIASPGGYCSWLDKDYVDFYDREWIGFAVDEDDLMDDLYDRELEVRAQLPLGTLIPQGVEITRRVHDGKDNDYEELLYLMWDMDPTTGFGPDTRIETVSRRWVSCDKTPQPARSKLWLKI